MINGLLYQEAKAALGSRNSRRYGSKTPKKANRIQRSHIRVRQKYQELLAKREEAADSISNCT